MPSDSALFLQFVDEDLGCGSYLVGDRRSGEAVVVDPAFAIEQYIDAAADAGLRITRVLETHTHADHVSGHGRFALEHGVPTSIHPVAEPVYPFTPIVDGDLVEVGATRITVIHTPGHRPEHCAFVVDDMLALTGDSLFVGDAARPDLAVAAREGAQDLFHSLARLSSLADDVQVYPGHVAGSLCGVAMSPDHASTIGRERRQNAALAIVDEQEFVIASSAITTPRPPTTERVVGLNRGPWVPLPSAPTELVAAGGRSVLDVRPLADHVAGHLPGAFSVPLDGSGFGTKAAFVLDPDEPFVVHARSHSEAAAAAAELWAVGLFAIDGFVLGGATEPLPTLGVRELEHIVAAGGGAQILDVREPSERDAGYIPGSRNIPYRLLRRAGSDALERTTPIVTVCESGARAAIAASLLRAEGFDARAVVDGGIADYRGELVTFRRCGS